LSGARGRRNVLTWVKTRLKYLHELGIESALDGTVGVISKIRGGGCFLRFFGPLYLKNGSRYQNVPSKLIIENLKIDKFDSIHFFDI